MNHESTPTPTPAPPALSDWRTITALAEEINGTEGITTLSTHAIRHYVARADRNGLQPHVRRLGRKILVSKTGFAAWLNSRPSAWTATERGR